MFISWIISILLIRREFRIGMRHGANIAINRIFFGIKNKGKFNIILGDKKMVITELKEEKK